MLYNSHGKQLLLKSGKVNVQSESIHLTGEDPATTPRRPRSPAEKLQAIVTYLKTHTHSTGVGPSGVPTVPPQRSGDEKSTKLLFRLMPLAAATLAAQLAPMGPVGSGGLGHLCVLQRVGDLLPARPRPRPRHASDLRRTKGRDVGRHGWMERNGCGRCKDAGGHPRLSGDRSLQTQRSSHRRRSSPRPLCLQASPRCSRLRSRRTPPDRLRGRGVEHDRHRAAHCKPRRVRNHSDSYFDPYTDFVRLRCNGQRPRHRGLRDGKRRSEKHHVAARARIHSPEDGARQVDVRAEPRLRQRHRRDKEARGPHTKPRCSRTFASKPFSRSLPAVGAASVTAEVVDGNRYGRALHITIVDRHNEEQVFDFTAIGG